MDAVELSKGTDALLMTPRSGALIGVMSMDRGERRDEVTPPHSLWPSITRDQVKDES